MHPLALHEFHRNRNAHFVDVNGAEAVGHYGDWLAEHAALRNSAVVLDLSCRGRICLTGTDRVRFLHGQVTNDIKRLRAGEGCYATLVNPKGKMDSDLNVFCLEDELLLDFEPGLTRVVSARLEKYIVADDVQCVDVAPHYGLLSIQGPTACEALRSLKMFAEIPAVPLAFAKTADETGGELYLMNQPRTGVCGFDLFVPTQLLETVAGKLIAGAKSAGGGAAGWQALEIARIEAGIPRFGADMDESNIPLECDIEQRAISYTKGCYIGQEVINRIHTMGHVTKELRGVRLANDLPSLPVKGDKLFHAGKEVGYITSVVKSPARKANLALAYVRREANQPGTELVLRVPDGESPVTVVALPF